MIKVALVNENGEIVAFVVPYNDADFPDRSYDEFGRLLVHVPMETPDDFVLYHYWDGTEFVERSRAPSIYYEWINLEWVFNNEKFKKDAEQLRKSKLNALIAKRLRNELTPLEDKLLEYKIKELRKLDLSQWDSLDFIEWPKEI